MDLIYIEKVLFITLHLLLPPISPQIWHLVVTSRSKILKIKKKKILSSSCQPLDLGLVFLSQTSIVERINSNEFPIQPMGICAANPYPRSLSSLHECPALYELFVLMLIYCLLTKRSGVQQSLLPWCSLASPHHSKVRKSRHSIHTKKGNVGRQLPYI
jgi:hypothetical protein